MCRPVCYTVWRGFLWPLVVSVIQQIFSYPFSHRITLSKFIRWWIYSFIKFILFFFITFKRWSFILSNLWATFTYVLSFSDVSFNVCFVYLIRYVFSCSFHRSGIKFMYENNFFYSSLFVLLCHSSASHPISMWTFSFIPFSFSFSPSFVFLCFLLFLLRPHLNLLSTTFSVTCNPPPPPPHILITSLSKRFVFLFFCSSTSPFRTLFRFFSFNLLINS